MVSVRNSKPKHAPLSSSFTTGCEETWGLLIPLNELYLRFSHAGEITTLSLCWDSTAIPSPFVLTWTTCLHSSSLPWNITSWVKPSMKSQIRLGPVLIFSLLFFFIAALWIPWRQGLRPLFLWIPRAWHRVRTLPGARKIFADLNWVPLRRWW